MTLAPAALLVLVAAASAAAPRPRGAVDLDRRLVRCTGVAAPALHEETENVTVTRLRTVRAARRDAVGSCLAAVRTLPVARGTAGDRLDADAQLARDVAAAIRAVPPVDAPHLYADGGASVALVVPLDGRLSHLLLGTPTWPAAGRPPGGP